MQADGLVMEIVKRFTEPLHQIKDIMELKGSKRPYWSSSLSLTLVVAFLVVRNTTQPSEFQVL